MQAKAIAILALTATFTFGWGCSDLGQPLAIPEPSGAFAYIGYDLNANLVLTGTVHLSRQGNELTGKRNLHDREGAIDSGRVAGIINPSGTIEVTFDPYELQLFYVVVVGKGTTGAIIGDVFTEGERTRIKTGTFILTPLTVAP